MRRDAERVFDEYLVAAARAGDQSAFARLAARWGPKLLAHAYRLTSDYDLAQDVAQDGWSDIAKGVYGLKDTAAFPAWAHRIITRRAADAIRRRQRDRRGTESFASEPRAEAQSAASIEAVADQGPLRRAMAALPPDQRAAIALHYGQGFSVAEIAASLQVPAGTVKTRLMHARRKLRAVLEGDPSNDRH